MFKKDKLLKQECWKSGLNPKPTREPLRSLASLSDDVTLHAKKCAYGDSDRHLNLKRVGVYLTDLSKFDTYILARLENA